MHEVIWYDILFVRRTRPSNAPDSIAFELACNGIHLPHLHILRTSTKMAEQLPFTCLYFGYGNTLSPRTLKQRCPESAFAGLARLNDYKWIINEPGFANIVPSKGDHVYGSLAFLSARDEAALDASENVPHHYVKQNAIVTRIDKDGKDLLKADGTPQTVSSSVHIDVQRTQEGTVNPEYILWINRAVNDATKEGLPIEYAEKYIRPFVPAREETEDERSTNMVVRRLRKFRDLHFANRPYLCHIHFSGFRTVYRHPQIVLTGHCTVEESRTSPN